jgi:hypothetical protein
VDIYDGVTTKTIMTKEGTRAVIQDQNDQFAKFKKGSSFKFFGYDQDHTLRENDDTVVFVYCTEQYCFLPRKEQIAKLQEPVDSLIRNQRGASLLLFKWSREVESMLYQDLPAFAIM